VADNTELLPGAGGDKIRDIDDGLGVKTQVVLVNIGTVGVEVLLTQPLTDEQLRAAAVPISGNVGVLGSVEVVNDVGNPLPVSATSLPLPTGASTEATLALIKAKTDNFDVALSTRAVTGLTDAQLRATPVPVSGTVTANAGTGPFPVSDNAGSLTVDAPVGAPVFVRLSDGAAALIAQKTMALSVPVVLASDQSRVNVSADGDVDHDAANTLKNIQVAGNASSTDVPPTLVSANTDRVRLWADKAGALIIRRRKLRESYTAVYRLAEAAARLDQTFTQVANTNKQWMTLHHIATSTKELRLMRWVVYITGWTIVSQAILELRQLSVTTPPATGNPAITPTSRRQGGGAAEAVALYLPTTQGSELGVNSPIASRIYDLGVMAAGTAVNPTPEIEVVLYDASKDDDEMLPPVFPLGAYAGLAVMLRTVGAPAVRMTGVATFTEEIV
jgi:hypothetical protein